MHSNIAWDLIVSVIFALALALALFVSLRRIELDKRRRWVILSLAALTILFSLNSLDALFWFELWPASLAVIGARLPLLWSLAILAAMLTRPQDGPLRDQTRLRREFWGVALLLLGVLASVLEPWLLPAPPDLPPKGWKDGQCLQSHESSCSAAAAATLLKSVGLATSEREMQRLCLTSRFGTSIFGLARGLAKAVEHGSYRLRVERVDRERLQTLRKPVILIVWLAPGAGVDPRYQAEWGWTPGVRHTVLFYGFLAGGYVDIGDPAVGRERWHESSLDVLWHGRALSLERRP